MIYVVFFILLLAEVCWDVYHEIYKNEGPNYAESNAIRFVVGICYWIAVAVFDDGLSMNQWVLLPFLMFMAYWFFFSYFMNVARNLLGLRREYYYLGKSSDLDRFQVKYGGAFIWFWSKAFIVFALTLTFILLR
jgi:hypothetical protein